MYKSAIYRPAAYWLQNHWAVLELTLSKATDTRWLISSVFLDSCEMSAPMLPSPSCGPFDPTLIPTQLLQNFWPTQLKNGSIRKNETLAAKKISIKQEPMEGFVLLCANVLFGKHVSEPFSIWLIDDFTLHAAQKVVPADACVCTWLILV